jgi:hypothetical protein
METSTPSWVLGDAMTCNTCAYHEEKPICQADHRRWQMYGSQKKLIIVYPKECADHKERGDERD